MNHAFGRLGLGEPKMSDRLKKGILAGSSFATLAMLLERSLSLLERDTLEVAPKLVIDGLYGANFPEADQKDFDPTSLGDHSFRNRLLSKWPNMYPNKSTIVEERDIEHHHSLMKKKFEKHAYPLNMHQEEYFDTTVKLFERAEPELHDAFISSAGISSGFFGYRPFLIDNFITKLERSKLYPVVDTFSVDISPGGQPRSDYQVVCRINLYLDDTFRFIRSPLYYPWQVQGIYDPKSEVFLM